MWIEAGCFCLLSRHRLQRLGRRRASRKCTRCAWCCHFTGISWLHLFFPFLFDPHILIPFPPPPAPDPNCLTCYTPSPNPWRGLHALGWGSSPPVPEPLLAGGRARPGTVGSWSAAGRRRRARTPGPPGIVWGWVLGSLLQELCVRSCRGVTPPSLPFPRCSSVAADVFLYWFFTRLALLFGGSGRESRQLLLRSSPRRSRGLCSRSWAGAAGSPPRPLPTDRCRPPLRPGHGEGGLPAALPQPREGWLWGRDAPRPFLPGA